MLPLFADGVHKMGLMNRKQVAAELLQIRLLLREKKLLTPNSNQALILAREMVTIRRPLEITSEPKPIRASGG
jgi:hypothetical protein